MSDEPKYVVIQVRGPRNGDQGITASAYYTVIDGAVSLTDRRGEMVRNHRGDKYVQPLQEGEDARLIAGRLLKRYRSAVRGNDRTSGFGAPIVYPRIGVA